MLRVPVVRVVDSNSDGSGSLRTSRKEKERERRQEREGEGEQGREGGIERRSASTETLSVAGLDKSVPHTHSH